MKTIEDSHDYIRKAMNVRRYHQYQVTQDDTVGKHSIGVAMIVLLINPAARGYVIINALTHDLGEFVTGDVPSPAKKALPPEARSALGMMEERAIQDLCIPSADMADHEVQLLKVADLLDGLSYCTEEIKRGNRTLIEVGFKFREYLLSYLNNCIHNSWYPSAIQLTDHIFQEFRNASK